MNALRLILVSALLLLSGCGFHLRGNIDLPAGLQQMHIDGAAKHSALGLELRRSLKTSGVNIVNDASSAQVILKVSSPSFKRRLLSVSGTSGKTTEYELTYTLNVSLVDRKGNVLLAPQTLRQLRDYTYDQNNVLGKGDEQSRLQADMQRDLVRQVLNRLQAYNRG
ncbi:MAG: hypothetical protein KAT25_04305 [Sulfuriflexus sp.]|nr:hypothetical protein [Sulfuriflexus sp.]